MKDPRDVKVLVTREFPTSGLHMLVEKGFKLTLWEREAPMTPAQLKAETRHFNALFCTLTEKIDADYIKANAHLDIISQFAVGYDNIDISAATKAGIPVGYTPGAMTEATADISFGLMIATARKMFFNHKIILNGEWGTFVPCANLGMELDNKTLGVFGMGRIGLNMAMKCKGAYNMDVIYHSRSVHPEAEEKAGARRVDFNTLLEQSDVISVHSVLSPETQGIFNYEAFKKMKRDALFINTARGPVHNQDDLVRALDEQLIWGTGLDVTDPEPMDRKHPLLSMDNVCVLPHIGSATREARDKMSRMAAENIIAFYTTGRVPHIVNPGALSR